MYYSINKFSKMIGRTPQTLRNWDKRGILAPVMKSSNGYRYYSEEQYLELLSKAKKAKITVGYCRVSSKKQSDDLCRQVENMKVYLTVKGNPFEIIEDIGSGINYNKKGLQTLIDKVLNDEIDKVVVLHKDRLVRFGYELIEYICKKKQVTIEVVDSTPKSEEQELVEDMIQIVTVFSCRLQGKRSNKMKTFIKELKENENV